MSRRDAETLKRHPVGELLGDLVDDATSLIGHELELAHAEVSAEISRARQGAAAFGVAAVFGLCALGALTAAAVIGLGLVMEMWLAALIVGGALIAIAAIAGAVGRARMARVAPPVPRRAMRNIKRDLDAAVDGVRTGHDNADREVQHAA